MEKINASSEKQKEARGFETAGSARLYEMQAH
jgi:hypothetical protein